MSRFPRPFEWRALQDAKEDWHYAFDSFNEQFGGIEMIDQWPTVRPIPHTWDPGKSKHPACRMVSIVLRTPVSAQDNNAPYSIRKTQLV